MSVGMLLFWAVLITGVVLPVCTLMRSDERNRPSPRTPAEPPATPGPARPSPEQVLADRFARGERDEQEFRARLAALHDVDHLTEYRPTATTPSFHGEHRYYKPSMEPLHESAR